MSAPHSPYGQPPQPHYGQPPQGQPAPGHQSQGTPPYQGYPPQGTQTPQSSPPPYGAQQQPPYPPQQPHTAPADATTPSTAARAAMIILGLVTLGTGIYAAIDVLDNSSWTPQIWRLLGGIGLVISGVLLLIRLRVAIIAIGVSTLSLLVQTIIVVAGRIGDMDPARGDTLDEALFHWASFATVVPALILTALTCIPPVARNLKPVRPTTNTADHS